MKPEEIHHIADDRRATHRSMWRVVGKLLLAVAGLAGVFASHLPQAPLALYPKLANLGTYFLLGGLAGLTYLYIVRPNLTAFLSAQTPSIARSPKEWQYAVLTKAIGKHGLTGALAAVVGANVVSYALIAAAAWHLRPEVAGFHSSFLTATSVLAAAWALMYASARLLPRRSFAASHDYIRRIELGLVKKLRGEPSDIPLGTLRPEQFNRFVRVALWRKRLGQALFFVSCVLLAYLFYGGLPADMFAPVGFIGASVVILGMVTALAGWTALATVRADNSHDLLGQLEYALSSGEITEIEARRTFQVIEILRVNHLRLPGGFNQVFELAAQVPPPLQAPTEEAAARPQPIHDPDADGHIT